MNIEEEIALVAKINEATKDIPDEETRKMAFKSLLAKAGLATIGFPDQRVAAKESVADDTYPPKKTAKKSRLGSGKGTPDIDPDLNLEPEGKPSFGDFVQKRTLKSHIDKISGAIYYLRHVLDVEPVGIRQAATCYQDQNWDWPTDFKNMISQGKKAKRFVYEDFDDLKLTAIETNAMRKESSPSDS